MIGRSPELAALVRECLFEPDIVRSGRGEPPSGTLESRLRDKLTCYI